MSDSEESNAVNIDSGLKEAMRVHQKEGTQFMIDICVNSFRNKQEAGGCILAHEMGLGEFNDNKNMQKWHKKIKSKLLCSHPKI